MNTTTLKGEGQDLLGSVKQAAGNATGTANKAIGTATDTVAPLADKARAFAKDRPFATAALVGVVGIALLNTLRGK
jgi:uncharacterized protein YjbJ (UPF0337 family)